MIVPDFPDLLHAGPPKATAEKYLVVTRRMWNPGAVRSGLLGTSPMWLTWHGLPIISTWLHAALIVPLLSGTRRTLVRFFNVN